MDKIRVSAVSYTNTKPFVYGLQHSGVFKKIELSLDIPSDCAGKLIANQADIGLIPVAALLQIPDYHIISDFCIGSNGPVDSVFIFSTKPINQVKTVCLDKQSRTSNGLAKILLKHHWKCVPEFVEDDQPCDAFVEIGDRTFGKRFKYPFVYDLAREWKIYSGLPFVFATWTANKPIGEEFQQEFNGALKFGLSHIQQIIKDLPVRTDFDYNDYLLNKLNFNFDKDKRKALKKYLGLLETI